VAATPILPEEFFEAKFPSNLADNGYQCQGQEAQNQRLPAPRYTGRFCSKAAILAQPSNPQSGKKSF